MIRKVSRTFYGKGLYLETTEAGNSHWRFKFRFNGKENRLSLGPWPLVGLGEANKRCRDFRELLAKGINPSDYRKENPLPSYL